MSLLLPFVALEFSSALGPPAGRYIVRKLGEQPRHESGRAQPGDADVLQIITVGASAARGGLVFRRARKAESDDAPRDVSILIASLIGATNAFASHSDAVSFLDGCRASEEEQRTLVTQCVDVINLAIRGYKSAARDPFAAEIEAADAREVRIGYGEPDELAKGGWTEAFNPPPPRAPRMSRAERLAPHEVVANVVSGRLPLLAAEDLALRTMLDLEHGRPRAAALQLRACLELIVAELTDAGEAWIPPRDDLERRLPNAERLAALALDDRVDEDAEAEVAEILDRIEDSLEDWRAWHTG